MSAPASTRGHPETALRPWRGPAEALVVVAVTVPTATLGGVLATEGSDPVRLATWAFLVAAVAGLALAPRGLLAARTWVIGYLVLQFPVRALFLLSSPKESPPLFAELSPGVGLEEALRTALLQSLLGLAVMLLVYALVRRPRDVQAQLVIGAELRGARLAWLLVVAVLLLPVELAVADSSSSGGGFILSMPGLAAAGASAAVVYAFAQAPRRHLVAFLLVVGYSCARVTLLHSKLSLLGCLVALLLSMAARERRRLPARSVTGRGLVVVLAGTVLALGVFAVSSGRSQGQTLPGAVGQGGEAVVSRSYGIDALVASDAYLDAGRPSLHGETFSELAYSWVPRQLWPGKPRSFSIRFGEDVFSFSHSVGSEFFAPSYSGEWLLNFGLVGLLVGWALFGLLLAQVDGMASLVHRALWIISLTHLVEGSLVAQAWLAAPFVAGGYWVLVQPHRATAAPRSRP
ncbi:MAG: hypothetical protein JWN17_3243 [Frankiales bacterium]|nr:hypothetical protein [Frankiales bacterium]